MIKDAKPWVPGELSVLDVDVEWYLSTKPGIRTMYLLAAVINSDDIIEGMMKNESR